MTNACYLVFQVWNRVAHQQNLASPPWCPPHAGTGVQQNREPCNHLIIQGLIFMYTLAEVSENQYCMVLWFCERLCYSASPGERQRERERKRERERGRTCLCSCACVYKQSPPLPIALATTAVGILRRFGPASCLMLMFIATWAITD